MMLIKNLDIQILIVVKKKTYVTFVIGVMTSIITVMLKVSSQWIFLKKKQIIISIGVKCIILVTWTICYVWMDTPM